MKNFIALLIMLCNAVCYSQKYDFKKELPTILTSYGAGLFEGTAETLEFHYTEFNKVFPNANDQFWDGRLSWKNKYKNGDYTLGPKFFGSTTFFVWTTDGYHLMRAKRNILIGTTIALHPYKKKKFKHHLLDLAIHNLAFNLGFTTTYNLIFSTR